MMFLNQSKFRSNDPFSIFFKAERPSDENNWSNSVRLHKNYVGKRNQNQMIFWSFLEKKSDAQPCHILVIVNALNFLYSEFFETKLKV
jgi:hypothetical protein